MGRFRTALAAVGGALGLWVAWGLYVDRRTERVSYDAVRDLGGAEVRQYPETVLVETTASDQRTAFRQLYRYLDGENVADAEVAMTAPVLTRGRVGRRMPMTAPVRTDDADGRVTMAFYLPAGYDPATAPRPTESGVRLVVEPTRTVAARSFSWFATDGRVAGQRRALLQSLEDAGVTTSGDPYLLRYDDPYTPPFMRRNEVAVPVDPESLPA